MVVLVMSFGPFRMCLVSCTHSIHGQHSISSYNITLGHYEFDNEDFLKRLSEDYQWMDGNGNVNTENPLPPFELQFIQAGSRVDWSWYTFEDGLSCEVNWLDPEPSCESCDYETYVRKLRRIERCLNTNFYRGYYEPPNEEEYRRLCQEF